MIQTEASLYPKRRQDLRITDQEVDGETIFIVVDEKTDAYYRFAEIEFGIFWNLDGNTPLPKVKEIIEEEVGDVEIPIEHLESFVKDLGRRGLLEGTELAPGAKGAWWRNIFYLREINGKAMAFNPDKLLNKLVAPLSFMYETRNVMIGLVLALWSVGFVYAHHTQWLKQVMALFHGWGLVSLYASLLMVGFVHEMGHALTCKYYGGRVRQMGFMLIYFSPAFYANVSDAYAFRNKYHRMYVGAAGLYSQFVFGAFVCALWYFTIPGTSLSNFLVGAMGMNGFTALWNLNPLIKLDGYYVLGDLLEVTNLRANSFRYLGWVAQKLGLLLPEAHERIEQTSPRLRRVYLWYGIFGFAFTYFILYRLFRWLLMLLIHKFSGFGVVLFTGGFIWGLWNWKKRAAPGITKMKQTIKENPYIEWILMERFRKFRLLILIAVLLLVLPIFRLGLKGPCDVRPTVKLALAPLERGVVYQVFRREGDSMKAGEPFARLDDFDLRRELVDLRLEKELKQERLALLTAEYGSSLATAKGAYSEAQIALSAHRLLSPHTLEEARARYVKSKATYDRLHRDLLRLKAENPPERIAQIEEELKKAQAEWRVASADWKRYQELEKESVVSPKEVEDKRSAYESATDEVARLTDNLEFEKKNLILDEKTAFEDYLADKEAYDRTLKQVSTTDPEKLRVDLEESQKNYAYALDKKVEIQAARSELEQIGERITTDEQKEGRMVIKSPTDGVIMTPHVNELAGKMVDAGQAVGWVYQPGSMIFEIRVNELDIKYVPKPPNPGTPPDRIRNDVKVKILAVPNHSFWGHVSRIVPESLTNPSGKAYLVDVEVSDPDNLLLPGMQGTGKIYSRVHYPLLWNLIRRPFEYVYYKLWSLF